MQSLNVTVYFVRFVIRFCQLSVQHLSLNISLMYNECCWNDIYIYYLVRWAEGIISKVMPPPCSVERYMNSSKTSTFTI